MEEEDAAADPYLPYDGGGDTIPLQEIPKRGMQHPLVFFFAAISLTLSFPWLTTITDVVPIPSLLICTASARQHAFVRHRLNKHHPVRRRCAIKI